MTRKRSHVRLLEESDEGHCNKNDQKASDQETSMKEVISRFEPIARMTRSKSSNLRFKVPETLSYTIGHAKLFEELDEGQYNKIDQKSSDQETSMRDAISRFEPRLTRSKSSQVSSEIPRTLPYTIGHSPKGRQCKEENASTSQLNPETSPEEHLNHHLKPRTRPKTSESRSTSLKSVLYGSCNFIEPAIERKEAEGRWPHRYTAPQRHALERQRRKFPRPSEELESIHHYTEANVDGNLLRLDDTVTVNPDTSNSKKDHVAKIVELYEPSDKTSWCRLQWFYRPEDTAIAKDGLIVEAAGQLPAVGNLLFCSTFESDEVLDCIIEKVQVERLEVESLQNPDWTPCNDKYYYYMGYKEEYSTFYSLFKDKLKRSQAAPEQLLLDLYSGCGGMSTGLCMGARLRNVRLKTQWTVDMNKSACQSITLNHPESEVYNCSAENFLLLLKKWDELCRRFTNEDQGHKYTIPSSPDIDEDEDEDEDSIHEVEDIIALRASNTLAGNFEFKVKWKGYQNPDDDTWEPEENLKNSADIFKKFIVSGRARKILPRPGECDVVCGGPPCQGVSGKNQFRVDKKDPLVCEKNRQVIVFMDIVGFLKPRFILMENVVDVLRFADGIVGRYALTRLLQMQFQARLGLMAAGRYGVPQYRQRMFLWGAAHNEVLPPFPLPTHDVVNVPVGSPHRWTNNVVWFDGSEEEPQLQPSVTLGEAFTDLPQIDNFEEREEMGYSTIPTNDFQRLIRKPRIELESAPNPLKEGVANLIDHRPFKLNTDDLERTCLIPKRKGACFRDLPGVKISSEGKVDVERKNRRACKSGKPLVPNYTLTWGSGKNKRSFGRVWWDEIVTTVFTTVAPWGERTLHPDQDRTLSVRECARLQGFPDYYKFCGSVKDRFAQIGNAVSVPTARALGYCLAGALCLMADESSTASSGASISTVTELDVDIDEAVTRLPENFPLHGQM